MLVNENAAYSILIRANLQSDDVLITSNNRRSFGQKLQVSLFSDNLIIFIKTVDQKLQVFFFSYNLIILFTPIVLANTSWSSFHLFGPKPQSNCPRFILSFLTLYIQSKILLFIIRFIFLYLEEFVGQCSNRSSLSYIKEDFLYHRLIECTKRYFQLSRTAQQVTLSLTD